MIANGVFVKEYMKLDIMPYDVREPKSHEVMVKAKACGVCCGTPGCIAASMPQAPCPILSVTKVSALFIRLAPKSHL